MGIFLKVMKAKLLASGKLKNQKGVALLEYLLLAGGVLAAAAGISAALTSFFTAIGSEFSALEIVVESVVP